MGDWFGKYIGIQGVIALLLVIVYVVAALAVIALPTGYTELLSLTIGFYFAKNGVGVIRAARGGP